MSRPTASRSASSSVPGAATSPVSAGPFLANVGVRELIALGRASAVATGPTEHILDLVPAGIFACAPDGSITFFNQHAADLWGRQPPLHAPEENFCAGQKLLAAAGSPLRPEETPMALAAREGRPSRGFGVVIERPDGSRYDASLDVDPLRDAEGKICGAITVWQDVTDARRRERDLAFLAHVNEQIADVTADAEIMAATTRAVGEYFEVERCFFVETDEMRGEVCSRDAWRRPGVVDMTGTYRTADLVQPEAWEALAAGPLAVADTTAHPWTANHTAALNAIGVRAFVVVPCGAARPRGFALGLASNQPRRWRPDEIALLENVIARVWPRVERARVEERVRMQQRELQLIGANAPAILSHWDRHHRLIFASRAFAGRWNQQPEELLGRLMPEVLGEEAFARLQPYLQRVLAGENVSFELEVPYRQIGSRYVQVSYAPDCDERGQVRGYLAAVLDMTDRRRAEVALFESEERLRLATRTGKVGLWDWDVVQDRVTWTESLYEIHGIRPSAFVPTAEGFLQLVHPDDRLPVQRAIQSALEHDARFELELRARRPGGAVIWLFTNATVIRENGRPVRMVGATLDISARKTAELALRESEARFRLLVGHAPVGIFLTDTKGDVLFVNESWCAMAGLSVNQARGRGWGRALHPADRERVLAEWHDCVRAHRPFACEYRFRRPDGQVVWLQGSAVESRNAAGVTTGYLGTVVDITERKAAEDALRASEKRFRTLASHAPVGIFLTNAAGDTIFVNEAWSQMAGVAADRAHGRDWSNAIHPADRVRVLADWEAAVAADKAISAEYRFQHADGRMIWVQGNAVPLRDSAGKSLGYIGTIADVTQSKALARELELRVAERTASLREAIGQMEEFSYSVSHDLRGPLRAMRAYAQALIEDYGERLDDTARNYLERIRRNSERMENLTRDVLTYSQVGRADFELQELNLETLLRDVVAQYPELQPSVADLQIEVPLHRVRGHEASLGQCLANLLTNAAKFVEPGTRPHIIVRTVPAGERVRLWVEDNGIGIAPHHQAGLFSVFERVPTRHAYEGTGIGLAIVRRAMEKMGGRWGVESDGKSGSRFWIELPRA